MATSREWLKLIHQQGKNPDWFRSQSESLHRDIQRGFNTMSDKSGFMQVFTEIIPLLPMEYRLGHWLELSRKAVEASYDLRDFQMRVKTLNAVGAFQLFMNATEDAEMSFNTAFELADDIHDNKAQIESLIGYLRLQSMTKRDAFTFEDIPRLLMYHAQDRDLELSARMYRAIGELCNQYNHFDRATAYSRLSYSYWKTEGELAELARTAYILAVSYRELRQIETANYFLEHAATLYAKTHYVRQYMWIAYEYGVHYYLEKNYPAALQWLEMSWEEAQKLDDELRRQRVEHCLGIVMSMFRPRLEEARRHLENALKVAEAKENANDIVHIRHSLAFNTARQGDYTVAKNEINYGLELAAALPDELKRNYLIQRFEELLQMIDDNDPRLWE